MVLNPMAQNIVEYECERLGLRWIARLVTPGMGYGRWSRDNLGHQALGPGNWEQVFDKDSPVVEFYNETGNQTALGEFITRYFLQTLENAVAEPVFDALPLYLNKPSGAIAKRDLEKVLQKFVPLAQVAAAQQQRQFKVLLANRGNPDLGQDPRACLFTAPDDFWLSVPSLDAASAAVRNYLDAFGLGGGNWIGGLVIDANGIDVARISYNGRVFDPDGHSVLQEAADQVNYQRHNEDWFFAQQLVHSEHSFLRQIVRGG